MHPIVAICNPDGVILRTDMDNGTYPPDGETFFGDTVQRIYNLEGLTEGEFAEYKVWESTQQQWIDVPTRPNLYATWDRTQVPPTWNWEHDRVLDEVRNERNMKLFLTDWTMMSDNALTTEQRQAMIAYRKELRDITKNMTKENTTSIYDVVWPTPPF